MSTIFLSTYYSISRLFVASLLKIVSTFLISSPHSSLAVIPDLRLEQSLLKS